MTAATDSVADRRPATWRDAVRVFWRYWSPRVLAMSFVGALAARLWAGDWSGRDATVVVGLVAWWPLQEWLIHVFVLHFKPIPIGRFRIDPLLARRHREHHAEPTNLRLTFIPLESYLYTLPLSALIWWAITPTVPLMLTGLAAQFALSVHYEWVHYVAHTRYVPKWGPYRRLWVHHRQHHFKNECFWYGVSMRGGDWLLRTMPSAKAVPTSPNCRQIEAGL